MIAHRLSDKNLETMTAICSICGPVTMLRDSRGRAPRCAIKARNERNNAVRRNRLGQKGTFTVEQHEAMLVAQSNQCAICHREVKLVVDHSHDTGQVRGLLCTSCNKGLGNFRDSLNLLSAAMRYLQTS